MEIEKIHNLSEVELAQQQRQAAEQIFRLRFQMRMGQNDGLQKMRALKKDVARMKTVVRQRQLGIVTTLAADTETVEQVEKKADKSVKVAVKAAKTATKKAKPTAKKAAVASKTKKEGR